MIAVTVTQLYTAPNSTEWTTLSAQATKLVGVALPEMPGWTRAVTQNAPKRQVTITYKGTQSATAGF